MQDLNGSIYNPPHAKYINRLAAFIMDFIIFLILSTGILYLIFSLSNYSLLLDNLHEEQIKIGYLIPNELGEYEVISSTNIDYESVILAYTNSLIISSLEFQLNKLVIFLPSIAIILSLFILEFIIPLFLKNGQTIGKKCFNISLISNNHIKINTLQLFIKTLFGKILIVSLIPYFSIIYSLLLPNTNGFGIILALIIYIFNFVLIIASKNKSNLSDSLVSCYLVISNETIFFNNEKELKEYIKEQ